jgi:hypothetical protein
LEVKKLVALAPEAVELNEFEVLFRPYILPLLPLRFSLLLLYRCWYDF